MVSDGKSPVSSAKVREHILRTLRCRNENQPGVFASLAAALSQSGTLLGDIRTVSMGALHIVRDIDVLVDNMAQLDRVVADVQACPGVKLLEVRDEVFTVHVEGKITIAPKFPVRTLSDLRRVYTPGVAEVCEAIHQDPKKARLYTILPNSVAIVTDGTAILGLGNIGPVAGMPVMEGKAALLAQFVNLYAVPILLASSNPDDIVQAICQIAPTFSGILLEDIAAPACFEIERRLHQKLAIPIMHDDQHSTATVALAAVMNACKRTGLHLQTARVGQIGLGAAGLAIARTIKNYTGNPVTGTDVRDEAVQRHIRHGGLASTLADIMATCDIVIATTGVPGLIKPEMVREGQIIFALSNPSAEIPVEVALAHGARFAVDGKEVNNLLAFPGLFRGALDAYARRFNRQMYVAAAEALAAAAHGDQLVPDPLDPTVHQKVAKAVAKVALESAVAGVDLDDDYFAR